MACHAADSTRVHGPRMVPPSGSVESRSLLPIDIDMMGFDMMLHAAVESLQHHIKIKPAGEMQLWAPGALTICRAEQALSTGGRPFN